MNLARVLVVVGFLIVLAVPLLFRSDRPSVDPDAADAANTLIIITPHNDQIRTEFGEAFARWHEESYGAPAVVIWNNPGGTSEIRKILQSQYAAALREGMEPDGADMVFGGGSYEFEQFKRPIEVSVGGETRTTTITEPVDFGQEWLNARYGENSIGDGLLYDPEGYWFGAALSGFGIVYNNDVLEHLQMDPPLVWSDLCHPDLQGWVALVNPGQSGSITTTFEIILQRVGWVDGWATLRRAGANARYFSGTSAKPPIDVSQGEAAMGICIDFYGRFQSQSILASGGGDRVGYVDPPGLTTIDADPIAILRGTKKKELAKRFIEFVLTEKGQSLWQFPAQGPKAPVNLGPRAHELRRMPIVRSLYADHLDEFIDQVNPYDLAKPVEHPHRDIRSWITVVFTSMTMDAHHELRDAWKAITEHPAYPHPNEGGPMLVRAEDVTDPTLKAMLELFDAMPEVPTPDGPALSLATTEHISALKRGWLRDGWTDTGLWHPHGGPRDELRRQFTRFFKENYQAIVRLAEEESGAVSAASNSSRTLGDDVLSSRVQESPSL